MKYPEAFIEGIKKQIPADFDAFMQSLGKPAPVSVRVNLAKPAGCFENTESVSWCSTGKYLPQRPSFTFDPLFHAGAYYVQEASSMFVEEVWRQMQLEGQPLKVLDMCAAPGGKSTHLLSLLGGSGLLVSNEIIPNRNKVLRENIIKWGYANSIITQSKPEDFARLENYFDVVVTDAPCSGEGLFRKDKEAITEWSEKNVTMCAARQKNILQHAAVCLKPGGYLIYSTCTYEPAENDDNIQWMIDQGMKHCAIDISRFGGIVPTKFGYQFYPHRVNGEGFYIAALQKTGIRSAPLIPEVKKTSGVNHHLQAYLNRPENFTGITKNDLVFALPNHIAGDFAILEKQLYIRNAGLAAGSIKGKDFLPSHDLALSLHINKSHPSVVLTEQDAITYLRCETPKIDTTHRGWCLATFQGLNLGWMKVMDNRLNNYYPKEWRILKRN